MISPIGFLLRE